MIPSFKKNLAAIITLVVLLIAIYGVIYKLITPQSAIIILCGYGSAMLGIKSWSGIKSKELEMKNENTRNTE